MLRTTGVTVGHADYMRDLFADAIRSYNTFINSSVIPAHDCNEKVSSFAQAGIQR